MTGRRLRNIRGQALVELTGACPEDCLKLLTSKQIPFWKYEKSDALTARFYVPQSQLEQVKLSAKKAMCTLNVIKNQGMLPGLRAVGKRIAYLWVLVLLTGLVFFLQKHIWFIEVTGNTTIPDNQILQILEEEGIGFGTSIDDIDLNLLKNQVLGEIPELGFLTINHHGGMATVVVRQREEKPQQQEVFLPANILAKKDGVILSVTATGGTPQVVPGAIVTEGDLLISGVTDLDKIMVVTRAAGEVYARTFSEKTVVLEKNQTWKAYTGRERRVLSVTFGKNTINFYKSSGISYGNYDKMTFRKTLTLPGDYALPVTLTMTTYREWNAVAEPIEEAVAKILLTEALERQLLVEMMAGEIENLPAAVSHTVGGFALSGVCQCREEIGSVAEIKD